MERLPILFFMFLHWRRLPPDKEGLYLGSLVDTKLQNYKRLFTI